MEKSRAGEIPEEVLFEILIRLPVKSLGRFRSVCPLWLSIFSDPYFIRCHYSHSKNRTKLIVMGPSIASWKKWLIYDADHPEVEPVRAGEFPSFWSHSLYDPEPGHGLIWLPPWRDRGREIGILNPSTGENITISHPQVTVGAWFEYGFGFDPVSDKHKVIFIYQTLEQYLELWVYTLGSVEKWRRVGVLDLFHFEVGIYKQVCIDGVIYFRAKCQGCRCLALFDLKSERFQMVELSLPGDGLLYVLIEFNGSVALVDWHVPDYDPRINVWVLEDFHKQVWELKRSISVRDLWIKTLTRGTFLIFECTLRGGELLVFRPFGRKEVCGLFFWNTRSNKFWRSRIHIPAGKFNWISKSGRYSEHVESLFPLKAT